MIEAVSNYCKQGYIKTHGLNQKKVQYLPTTKGFTEKMKKTYHYTQKTISELSKFKRNIQKTVLCYHNQGIKKFKIEGSGEFGDIAEIALRELQDTGIVFERSMGQEDLLIAGSDKILVADVVSGIKNGH